MKLMRALFLGIVLAIGLAVGALWLAYQDFLSSPIELGQKTLVWEVQRGASLRRLSDELAAHKLIEHPYFFMALGYLSNQATRIKAGEYEIPNGITPPKLLALFTSGEVLQRSFTVIDGWTFRQALDALAKDERLEKELGDAPSDQMIMTSLGHPDEQPEGRFFPDTYYFTKGTSDLEILRRAYETMERTLKKEWEKRDEDLPLESPYEALILASIVEKESALAAERPAIAGVFVRRLQLGMLLQTDPTVIYGLGEQYDGNITRADLLRDTPYNTYIRQGLPPTPIALPGRDAIHAALHPADGNSLYFVAKGDGSHYFSATLNEHNQAVQKYQHGKP